jgi:hypothetical protein
MINAVGNDDDVYATTVTQTWRHMLDIPVVMVVCSTFVDLFLGRRSHRYDRATPYIRRMAGI